MILCEAATIGAKTLFTYYSEHEESPREECDNFGQMVCWHRRHSLGDDHGYNNPEDFLTRMVIDHCDPSTVFRSLKRGELDGVRLRYDRSVREWQLESEYDGSWYCEDSYAPGLSEKNLPSFFIDKVAELLTINGKHTLLASVNGLIILPLYLYDHSGITISASPFSCPWDSGQVGWTYVTPESIVQEYGAITVEIIERARCLLLAEVKTYDCYLRGECYGYAAYEEECEIESCGGYLDDYDSFTQDLPHELAEEWRPLIDALSHCTSHDIPNYFWTIYEAG